MGLAFACKVGPACRAQAIALGTAHVPTAAVSATLAISEMIVRLSKVQVD